MIYDLCAGRGVPDEGLFRAHLWFALACAPDIPRVKNVDASVAAKVVAIERQEFLNAVHKCRCDKPGIVDLQSRYRVRRDIRQPGESCSQYALQFVQFEREESQAISARRSRGDVPALNYILRNSTDAVALFSKKVQCGAGFLVLKYSCRLMRRMRMFVSARMSIYRDSSSA